MTDSLSDSSDPLQMLSIFASGTLTIGVEGYPVLKVDAESKSVDIETRGMRECGIRLSKLVEYEGGSKGLKGLLKGSGKAAKGLSERGWSVALYDGGSRILRMGKGVSRLTGYVSMNPLKLKKILEDL